MNKNNKNKKFFGGRYREELAFTFYTTKDIRLKPEAATGVSHPHSADLTINTAVILSRDVEAR
jgi:hypothetical protein